jgi:hypothetical protein
LDQGHANKEPEEVIMPDGRKIMCPISFSPEQKQRHLAFDEKKVSVEYMFDGSGCGKPALKLVDPNLQAIASGSKKDWQAVCTIVFCTNAAGELLPPLVIFPCGAKDVSQLKVDVALLSGLPEGYGKFGGDTYQRIPAYITANEKASMTEDIFYEYVCTPT